MTFDRLLGFFLIKSSVKILDPTWPVLTQSSGPATPTSIVKCCLETDLSAIAKWPSLHSSAELEAKDFGQTDLLRPSYRRDISSQERAIAFYLQYVSMILGRIMYQYNYLPSKKSPSFSIVHIVDRVGLTVNSGHFLGDPYHLRVVQEEYL